MKFNVFLLAIFLSFFSTNVFAISDEDLAKACFEVGKEKIISQAESFGCKIDISTIYVEDIDNRWYNPSAFIWFQIDVTEECKNLESITEVIQYYHGDCF